MAAHDDTRRNAQFDRPDGNFDSGLDEADLPLGDLLRRFGQDAAALVRNEIALAKLELRDNIRSYVRQAAKLGVAAGVGLFGALALTTFAIVGLGALIQNYWLSALLVAAVLLGTAGFLARDALARMRRNRVAPRETAAALKEDGLWARHEAQHLKRKLTRRASRTDSQSV